MGLFDKVDKVDQLATKVDNLMDILEGLNERLNRLDSVSETVADLTVKTDHVWQEYVSVKSQLEDKYTEVKEQIKDFNVLSLFSGFDLKRWIFVIAGVFGVSTGTPIVSDVAHSVLDQSLGTDINANRALIQQVQELQQQLQESQAQQAYMNEKMTEMQNTAPEEER